MTPSAGAAPRLATRVAPVPAAGAVSGVGSATLAAIHLTTVT